MALTKINTNLIANNTIAVTNIADNAIDATKIASNSILTRHIDDDQVTGDQLADNLTIAGTLTSTGAITGTLATAAQTNITSLGTLTTLTVDDITINGSTISDGGDLTLDVAGNIALDADGGQIQFKDGGTQFGKIRGISSNLYLYNDVQDKDIVFRGNDDGVDCDALTLDMSAAGAATFNAGVTATTGAFSTAGNGNSPTLHVIDTADTEVAWFEGHRAGDTGAWIAIRHNPSSPAETNRSGVKFQADDDAGNVTQYAKITQYVDDNTNGTEDGSLAFNVIKNGTDTETMRLKAGNVGIGTNNPSADTGVARFLQIGSSSDAHSGLVLEDNSGQWELQNNADLAFFYDGSEKMRITAAGNVGIGAGSSTGSVAQLHVKRTGDGTVQRMALANTCEWDWKIGNTANITGGSSGDLELMPLNGNMGFAVGRAGTTAINMRVRDGKMTLGTGITFNGDTATANTLDDYEEGTWAPVFKGSGGNNATFTVSSATYTKVGRLVNCQTYIHSIDLADITSGTYILLDGFPFVASGYGDFSTAYRDGTHATSAVVGGYVQSGASYAYLVGTNGVEHQQSGSAALGRSMINVTYMTT